MLYLYSKLYDPDEYRSESDKLKLPPPPPWITANYDIPKSQRKGKTFEEIMEIKKQIRLREHPELNSE